MNHLILCREYPPAPYPAGGIGTYVQHISQLLAEAGETVHLIAQRWEGAPASIAESFGGKLIVHRILLDEPIEQSKGSARVLRRLAASDCPSQVFSWQAAQVAESLVESESIDVIEGQEWEFPLYYLQVRRALGLGPRKEPPCLIHLHSPSQLIFRYNEWDRTFTDYLPLIRFEEYTIKAADALVCPSHYLSRGAQELYKLSPGDIEVIPYPMGSTPHIERAPEVWGTDSICYVGRLELRKGLVEWVDAAVRVAESNPAVTFEFTGSDTSLDGSIGTSVEEHLKARIPREVRSRFVFRGSRSRTELFDALAKTSIVAVPSRWDNLPFTCIEAMSTGLPVLASPHGGMAELIADGESGWISQDGTASGLESALRRALGTPPARRAEMGERASAAVRGICGNEEVLRRHMELRLRLAKSGAITSRKVPGYSFAEPVPDRERRCLGFVVTCLQRPELLSGCLKSIGNQILPARMTVAVVHERFRNSSEIAGLSHPDGFTLIYTSSDSYDEARRMGANALLTAEPGLRAITAVCASARLDPEYVAACESVFDRQPSTGLISPWIFREERRGELDTGPCPVSLSEVPGAGLLRCAAIRVEALTGAETFPDDTANALWLALARGGWRAVTYPRLLASLLSSPRREMPPRRRFSVMVLAQSGSVGFLVRWFIAAPWQQKIRWLRRTLMQPRRIAGRISRQLRQLARQ